jgi:hypothetical protein
MAAKEHKLSTASHGTFSKIDHILKGKTGPVWGVGRRI